MKYFAVALLLVLALACSLNANAAISEIRKDFPRQTAKLAGNTEGRLWTAHGLRSQSAELHRCQVANLVPIVTDGRTTSYAFAGNIAQVPNSAGLVLEMFGDHLFLEILYADTDGAPDDNDGTYATFPIGILGAGYRSGTPDNPFTFSITTAINDSYTLGWGASPKYSGEVEVIQF